jgi:integrase
MRYTNRLTPLSVSRIKTPGLHHDGGGLYLQVTIGAGGVVNRSWIMRYMLDGKARKMGLGPVSLVSLPEARERALAARKAVHLDHVDPREVRDQERAARRAEVARAMSFEECARAYIEAHQSSWSNARHRKQWPETLQAYVYPAIGPLPVASIDTPLILKVLEPLWRDKQETAARVRARIERVLSWATVRGYRQGDNPARWRGHLQHMLARRSKRGIRHLAAMPYGELAGFMRELRQREGVAPRALEFCILTAARTSEVLHATWDEIDLDAKVWTVPAERMKAGKEHRVPLSGRAVAILSVLPRKGAYVFEGHRAHMAMLKVLQRMGRGDLTVHGLDRRSGTGRARKRHSRPRWSRWHWRMLSRARSRRLIGAATFSRSGARLWGVGPSTAPTDAAYSACRCRRMYNECQRITCGFARSRRAAKGIMCEMREAGKRRSPVPSLDRC